MWDKFGEFDSAEELNRAAAAQKAEGDVEAVKALAEENGIDAEDVEDYLDEAVPELTTPLMAAVGKLTVEAEALAPSGVLEDWKSYVLELCRRDERMRAAVRRKGKSLRDCMAALLRFSFETKIQINDEIVKAVKIQRNGRTEQLRGPIYIGIPSQAQAREIIRKYYLEVEDDCL